VFFCFVLFCFDLIFFKCLLTISISDNCILVFFLISRYDPFLLLCVMMLFLHFFFWSKSAYTIQKKLCHYLSFLMSLEGKIWSMSVPFSEAASFLPCCKGHLPLVLMLVNKVWEPCF
jgi:Na+/serine symporter